MMLMTSCGLFSPEKTSYLWACHSQCCGQYHLYILFLEVICGCVLENTNGILDKSFNHSVPQHPYTGDSGAISKLMGTLPQSSFAKPILKTQVYFPKHSPKTPWICVSHITYKLQNQIKLTWPHNGGEKKKSSKSLKHRKCRVCCCSHL